MKRLIQHRSICLLVFILTLSVCCTSSPKPRKTVKTVAFITNTTSDFWKIVRKGCEKADAELTDVTVAFKTTNDGSVEEQNRLIRQALDRDDADAIAVSPIDPAGQKKVINDAAKRALIITQDSDAPDTDRALYLGADNRAAGRQAGELVKRALPQGGKIMVFVGKREVENAQERFAGLKESLQGSKVEIIDLMVSSARSRSYASTTNGRHSQRSKKAQSSGRWRSSRSNTDTRPLRLRRRSEERRVGKECRSRWSPYH